MFKIITAGKVFHDKKTKIKTKLKGICKSKNKNYEFG